MPAITKDSPDAAMPWVCRTQKKSRMPSGMRQFF
jgi:hypothetical protein